MRTRRTRGLSQLARGESARPRLDASPAQRRVYRRRHLALPCLQDVAVGVRRQHDGRVPQLVLDRRARQLLRHPVCQWVVTLPSTTCRLRATDVDHIVPKVHGGTDDASNLQSLCIAHHRLKTTTFDRQPGEAAARPRGMHRGRLADPAGHLSAAAKSRSVPLSGASAPDVLDQDTTPWSSRCTWARIEAYLQRGSSASWLSPNPSST